MLGPGLGIYIVTNKLYRKVQTYQFLEWSAKQSNDVFAEKLQVLSS